jgi:hypothetical protein
VYPTFLKTKTLFMKRNTLPLTLLFAVMLGFSFLLYACKKTAAAGPVTPEKVSFVENFDTVARLYNQGWAFVNNSKPQGTATWQQGVHTAPDKGWGAQSYFSSSDEYALCNFNAGGGTATISSWMISPSVKMKNGDQIIFYTRTYSTATGISTFPDRMQLRLNIKNDKINIGNTLNGIGDFDVLGYDINPTYANSGPNTYPTNWQKYTYTISGMQTPLRGRFAFRYFVELGGPSGANSNAIGIDSVAFVSK